MKLLQGAVGLLLHGDSFWGNLWGNKWGLACVGRPCRFVMGDAASHPAPVEIPFEFWFQLIAKKQCLHSTKESQQGKQNCHRFHLSKDRRSMGKIFRGNHLTPVFWGFFIIRNACLREQGWCGSRAKWDFSLITIIPNSTMGTWWAKLHTPGRFACKNGLN